jgi:hypothetical protein
VYCTAIVAPCTVKESGVPTVMMLADAELVTASSACAPVTASVNMIRHRSISDNVCKNFTDILLSRWKRAGRRGR